MQVFTTKSPNILSIRNILFHLKSQLFINGIQKNAQGMASLPNSEMFAILNDITSAITKQKMPTTFRSISSNAHNNQIALDKSISLR